MAKLYIKNTPVKIELLTGFYVFQISFILWQATIFKHFSYY